MRRDTPPGALCDGMTRRCSCLFLDSGAHSLFNELVSGRPKEVRHDWYVNSSGGLSKRFLAYLDRYALFLKDHGGHIDHYATVDAIYSPEISWKSLKYLEREYGLSPVPVVHGHTDLKWVRKYLDAGYDYVGVGGLGQEGTKGAYRAWADQVFALLCPPPSGLPAVRVHGFAVTNYELLIRYPWYSVDSVSWAKAAGFGQLFVPHKRRGEFVFTEKPYTIGMSVGNGKAKGGTVWHYDLAGPLVRDIVHEWLAEVDVPVGTVDEKGNTVEYGVYSEYSARAVANLRFFERMAASLPEWPWPFAAGRRSQLFED